MKVSQLLDIFNEERPNQIRDEIKLRWLKNFETTVLDDVILTHELPREITEKEDFDPSTYAETYFDEWGMDFDLYIPEEFSQVYVSYLTKEACRFENEMDSYNVAATLFNSSYLEYQNRYNRIHMPIQRRPKYFDHTVEYY